MISAVAEGANDNSVDEADDEGYGGASGDGSAATT